MSTPLYFIKNGYLNFGNKTIFEDLEFYLYPGDKICLIGKNGCGKSSLLKTIIGENELDTGEQYKAPFLTISYLTQDMPKASNVTIIEYILEGLIYEENKSKADIIIDGLKINRDDKLTQISGGQLRRASLAKILVKSADILLLDEPTNHLDILSIEWLEAYIRNYAGTVICISHDRSFLSNVTNKIWWLDRGFLRHSNQGFSNFEIWQDQIIEHEENQLRKLNKKLQEENLWMQQGVTARRKRNQKRLSSLKALRSKRKDFESHIKQSKQKLEFDLENNDKKSKLIIEAEELCFTYSGRKIIEDFSLRIKKSEKIGIIGPNGTGKSTLVKLLIGELAPESGKIRRASSLSLTYFDQHRTSINEEDSLVKFLCPNGGDTIFLKDREMHVAGYLKQFLFDSKNIHNKISTLSGGERNRLLLAKSLISPGNFMVLDEPTNDLDMDTLDLLLEILLDYTGTIIIISHDRDFLEKLVTKTLIFDSTGEIQIFPGGYEDYKDHQKQKFNQKTIKEKAPQKLESISNKGNNKISYKFIHLHKTLPEEMEEIQCKIKQLEDELSNPTIYADRRKFEEISAHHVTLSTLYDKKFEEWVEIDEMITNTKIRN